MSLASPTLIVARPAPKLTPPPKVPANAAGERCIASRDAMDTMTLLDSFRRGLVDVAAAKDGWRRLGSGRSRIATRNAPRADGSIVDDQAQTWLLAGTLASCGAVQDEYFVDADGGVFSIAPVVSCVHSIKLSACGMLPAAGCGQPPAPAPYYVPAPTGARMLDAVDRSAVPLTIEVPTCISVEPTGGWAYPPAAAR